MTKKIVVYNPIRFAGEAWLPLFWSQAKTYYEKHGNNVKLWDWAPCHADIWADDYEQIKQILEEQQPDVFALSLYVWNCKIGHKVAEWVKQRWPKCLVVTGGPHQYFKHDINWFKQHPYIDASLPGECYGELALQEILDNLNNNGSINWDSVSDICYPSTKSRMLNYSKKTIASVGKKSFDYNWSAFDSQSLMLQEYINYAKQNFPKVKILSIFETTRGCPYGCTYCDWGGGINSQVLKKSMDYVFKDIDALCSLDLNYLYFADANFGIFGNRDVDIIKYLAKQRKQNLQTFTLGYGGFAKTENKLPYIRDILEIDLKNNMSVLGEIKISMQSLDSDVLKRIDRKNVGLDQQIAALTSVRALKKLPIYVELIHGLPGMTLNKFYHELDVLAKKNLSIQWYPWILLPEAPAYSREYRKSQELQTVTKTAGWWSYENDDNNLNEIVIGTSTYSKTDYFEMLMSSSLYKLFVQGGYMSQTRQWLESQNISLGYLISRIYKEFLTDTDFLQTAYQVWENNILTDPAHGCLIDFDGHQVYLGLYFPAVSFSQPEEFTKPLQQWLQATFGCPKEVLDYDNTLNINKHNFGKSYTQGLYTLDYRKNMYNYPDNLSKVFLQFVQFKNSGHILKAKKKFLGLF
jgi:putative methyltransferase